jgi:hypothetical protein
VRVKNNVETFKHRFVLTVSEADLKTTLSEEQQKDTILGPCLRAVNAGKAVTYVRYKRVSGQLRLDDRVLIKAGYRYFLLVGDMVSKYLEAIHMKEQTADSVVKAFWKGWVTRHGCATSNFMNVVIVHDFNIDC